MPVLSAEAIQQLLATDVKYGGLKLSLAGVEVCVSELLNPTSKIASIDDNEEGKKKDGHQERKKANLQHEEKTSNSTTLKGSSKLGGMLTRDVITAHMVFDQAMHRSLKGKGRGRSQCLCVRGGEGFQTDRDRDRDKESLYVCVCVRVCVCVCVCSCVCVSSEESANAMARLRTRTSRSFTTH